MRRKPARPRPDRRREPAVTVQVATRAARLPRATDVAAWVSAAGGARHGAVTVRLTGWRESGRLNHEFRGKAGATNVLAFPAGTGEELGDLVVCLPLVHREAREQGKTALQHLAHLVVHGTLHLLGHDHVGASAARRMERREVAVLRELGFPDPYRPERK
jgi:probable rRNA maturation factor